MFYGTTNAGKVMEKILKLLVLGTCLLKLTIPYHIYFGIVQSLRKNALGVFTTN
jgi:hypothetical protein